MKILIMSAEKSDWYYKKIGNLYDVRVITKAGYVTKDGVIDKKDAQIIK